MRSRTTTSRVAVALVAVLLLTGCAQLEQITGPQMVVPPGVQSSQTAAQVAKKMLAEIAANERTLGRALAPARIVRIQLLRPGEMFEVKHFDGTNPDGVGMSPDDGPGWMVEAVGTFVGVDHQTDQIDSLGTHGFHLWGDAGGESWGFIPCWSRQPMPAESMEGDCHP